MKILLVVLLLGVVYGKETAQKSTEEKLKVSVYYESLCPSCVSFITYHLSSAYQKIGSFLEVDLVPYGNTRRFKINDNWAYRCQHGYYECLLNTFQACGLARISNQTVQVEFASCVLDNAHSFGKTLGCAYKIGLDFRKIYECAIGSEGLELYGKLADKQENLDPPSEFSPWVVIGEKSNRTLVIETLNNFLETACKFLDNKPPGCAKTDV